ncbi:MAG: amino acid adenylation domain-containing protein, partial [Pseudoalteromonas sp.]|uniref:non-ribosomal peptide synthetase n=1 Tax=Pseudoalteromonas sp. TaxID=53249 RepID=UPI0025DD189F
MGIIDIRERLLCIAELGIKLQVAENKLRLSGNLHALDEEAKQFIKQNKSAIIELINKKSEQIVKIEPREDQQQEAPLSYAQQRLWLLDQMDEVGDRYNIATALKLSGKLDVDGVHYALTQIVERHQVLRTYIVAEGDQVKQRSHDSERFSVSQSDLSALPLDEQELRLQVLMAEESARSFDLSADLMIRARLYRLSAQEYVLQVTMHHIASDGWSMKILVDEFRHFYAQSERTDKAAALSLQYADYAKWQRDWLQGDVLLRHQNYWQQQLSDLPTEHGLALDFPRPKKQSSNGGCYRDQIDVTTGDALQALCRRHDATLFMGLHTVFSVLLSRYSQELDIVVGSPVANREQSEVAELIGFFVNTLVLRSDLSGEPDFVSLLERNRRVLLDAYEHQQMPFEQLVELLQPERSLSHSPLFQVMLILQNNDSAELSLPEVEVTTLEPLLNVAKYDLTLVVEESEQGLRLNWEYSKDVFTEATITRMAGHYKQLLTSLLAYPSENVFDVEMLTPSEQAARYDALLPVELSGFSDVYSLFSEQVQSNPDAVALWHRGDSLSYSELDKQAKSLAVYLREEHEVSVGERVGVFIPRSFDTVVVILGLFKAGLVYVPLDESAPDSRLNYQLEDAGVKTVLTDSSLLARLPLEVRGICLDEETVQRAVMAPQGVLEEKDWPLLTAESLAYIIYTSGSTGQPKGVMVEHGQLSNVLSSVEDVLSMSATDRLTNLASSGFDISLLEQLLPLLSGGSVQLQSSAEVRDVGQLVREMQQVSVLHAVPSLMRAWLNEVERQRVDYPQLRCLLVGGEAVPKTLVQDVRAYFPDVRLVEFYGPTENTIISTYHDKTQMQSSMHCIGRTFRHVQSCVVDGNGRLATPGSVGELYLGGGSVSRGYLHRPELTEERFINCDFLGQGESRYYRTGDLVRLLPDGTLEYVGRNDQQVKIRGYRVELGEIEEKLLECTGVKEAVVRAQDVSGQGNTLVAYVTLLEEEGSSRGAEDRLRQSLSSVLPTYMLPAHYVMMAQLPRNENGKLRLSELPAPELKGEEGEYVAPESELEQCLSKVWSNVLGVEKVGLNDNFFTLGGHSLLAIKVCNQLKDLLQIDIPINVIFESDSLKTTAQEIAQKSEGISVPLVVRQDQTSLAPASYGQRKLWLADKVAETKSGYNITEALQLRGTLDKEALKRSLAVITERHEPLRSNLITQDDLPYIKVSKTIDLPYEEISVEKLDSAEQQLRVNAIRTDLSHKHYNLAEDILFDVVVITLSEDLHVLTLSFHHVITDEWSTDILIKELQQIYGGLVKAQATEFEPLSVCYSDYASWHNNLVESSNLDLSYWENKLGDLPELHSLPVDNVCRAKDKLISKETIVTVEGPTSVNLKKLMNSLGVTEFVFFQSLFSLFIARISGESDIVIGTPISGRIDSKLEAMVGMFVNTLVIRNNIDLSVGFLDFIQHNKQNVIEAFEHQNVPFEKLVDHINPNRIAGKHPLFQIMFAVRQEQSVDFCLPALNVERLAPVSNESLFDLSLNVSTSSETFKFAWGYDPSLFTEATIASFAGAFLQLLESVGNNSNLPLSVIDILPSEQKDRIMARQQNNFNGVDEQPKTIDYFIVKYANLESSAVALSYQEQTLNYAELNNKVQKTALQLSSKGVRKGAIVGVSVLAALDNTILMLALFRLGATYLPLDQDFPQDRLAYMSQDAGVTFLISEPHFSLKLSEQNIIRLTPTECFSDDVTLSDELPLLPPQELLHETAYIIYTSGSTGQPKGVPISQSQLLNCLVSVTKSLDIKPSDIIANIASPAFDIAILEQIIPLISGATSRLINRQKRTDLNYLIDATQDVTCLHAVPTLMAEWLQATKQRQDRPYQNLRYLFVGGEEVPRKLITDLQQYFSNSELVEFYGPTENTIISTFDIKSSSEKLVNNCIGKAFEHIETFVVDEYLQPVPEGVVGELLLGGRALTNGYINQTEQQACKFVSLPWYSMANRFYKTGDMVKLDAVGKLQFIGRKDEQIKIRGIRVELTEIEHCIEQLPLVTKAVVVKSAVGESLSAFVQTEEQSPQDNKMKLLVLNHITEHLPHYMVPRTVDFVTEFPTTSTGKLNRKFLASKKMTAGDSEEYVAPKNKLQQWLCSACCQLLGLDQVSIDSNFFESGGNSLLAMRFINQLQELLSTPLNTRVIFDYPTIRILSQVLSQQFAEKLIELELLNQNLVVEQIKQSSISTIALSAPEASSLPELVISENKDEIPLSYAQQRLWFIDNLQDGSAHYHMPAVLRLQGKLDVAALGRAFKEIVCRHEALRTVIKDTDTGTKQVIQEADNFALTFYDFTDLSEELRSVKLSKLVTENEYTAFDLSQDYMLRSSLAKVGEDTYKLLFNMHHISSDGWSMGVLIRELGILYNAFIQSQESPLSELLVQYSDYSHWQKEWLQGKLFDRQLQFWLKQLDNMPLLHNLPLDYPRPMKQGIAGEQYCQSLDQNLVAKLSILCSRYEVTTFMLLHSVFALVLSRFSGDNDVVVGSPVAGRNHEGLEPLIGFFVNSLVMRTKIDPKDSFESLLLKNKLENIDVFNHQHFPFDLLVEKLSPNRSLSHHPLFQIAFAVQSNDLPELALKDVEIDLEYATNRYSRFDMALNVVEQDDKLELNWCFNQELFAQDTIFRLAKAFETLANEICRDPKLNVSKVMLTDEPTAPPLSLIENKWAPQSCIHQLIETQVEKAPDNVALVYEDITYTYDEVNKKANQLARLLRNAGATNDSVIALCLERSVEMVVAILAVLKSGAAYLPIDPEYPVKRINTILYDAKPLLLIKHHDLFHGDGIAGMQLLDLDDKETQEGINKQCDTNLQQVNSTPDDLVYVIYTSGTTGTPKGVMVEHKALLNRIDWMQQQYQLDNNETVLQKTPYSFDVSAWEFFWTLSYGAKLVVAEPGGHRDPVYLSNLMAQAEVSICHFVPSMLNAYLTEEVATFPKSLKRIFCGGETLDIRAVEMLAEAAPWIQVDNFYGPTEAAIGITCFPCSELSKYRTIPIGKPIQNVEVLLLGEEGGPSPDGAIGELYIGGAPLARGYINNVAETEAKFVWLTHPVTKINTRYYRTGDKVRRLFDGNLEYHGRVDDQVKLRGVRIELAEIRNTLLRIDESISGAHVRIVSPDEQNNGGEQLVAYVTPSHQVMTGSTIDTEEGWCRDWEAVSDAAHEHEVPVEIDLDIGWWTSSLTNEQISRTEMKAWIEATVARITALKPERLLEVGCGTGMLLYRYAPQCKEVRALDISKTVLAQVQSELTRREITNVQLQHGDALSVKNTQAEYYDTAVINSVVQYFPSQTYLEKVIELLLTSVCPGGQIFIGDVRNLDLHEHFLLAVSELKALDNGWNIDELQRQLLLLRNAEEELLISPAYFSALAEKYKSISHVDIEIKTEFGDTEMVRYRYDVVIHKTSESEISEKVNTWFEYNNLYEAERLLERSKLDVFGVSGIPNDRLYREQQLINRMYQCSPGESSEIFFSSVTKPDTVSPLDALKRQAESQGYICYPTWSVDKTCIDLIVSRKGKPQILPRESYKVTRLTNYPQLQSISGDLINRCKSLLAEALPNFMQPVHYFVLPELPVTLNGKVDNDRLPRITALVTPASSISEAVTETEKLLCQIWQEILDRRSIGIDDDFFALGGHSLLAIRVISQVRNRLGIEVPLKLLFKNATIRSLAQGLQDITQDSLLPPITPVEREVYMAPSFAQKRLWFIDRIEGNSAHYNMPSALKFEGELDVAKLQQTFAK